MNVLDCYKVLNVPTFSNWKEVKQSYYTLAKKYHPDVNYGDPFFESKFQKISQAYQVLGRQFQRRQVIKEIWIKNQEQRKSSKNFYPNVDTTVIPPKEAKREGECINDALVPKWKKKIEDIVFKYENKWAPLTVWQGVTVNSSQAAKGGAVRIHTTHSSFQVKIPAGVADQTQLRVRGKGEKSFFYDKRGDLYLNIRVIPADKPDSGNVNLFYEKKVSQKDIEQNKVFTLNAFQGLIKFFVPKDTGDGKSYVLKAKKHSEGFDFQVNHIVKIRIA
jgi:curved DNA-binding protein